MCLDTITKRYAKPSKKEVYAYKVFSFYKETGTYGFEFYGISGGDYSYVVPTGRWLKADEEPVPGCPSGIYTSGFHGICKKAAALGWADQFQKVVRVRMRYVHTEGDGIGGKNIVAREMYVPKPRKRKKA